MRRTAWFSALLLSALLLAPPDPAGRAYGFNHLGDGLFGRPAATVYAVPASPVVSTSYLVPTTYARTVYTVSPTAFVVPSFDVVPTTFLTSTRLVQRPVFTTTTAYLPTASYDATSYTVPTSTYFYPTVLAAPVATVAVCDEVVAAPRVVRPLPAPPEPAQAPRGTQSATEPETPPSAVESSVVGAPPVPPAPPAPAPTVDRNAATAGGGVGPDPLGGNVPPKPAPPAEGARERPAPPANPPAAKKQAETPPADDQGPLPLELPPEGVRREARRPVFPLPNRGGNVLSGVVRSYNTGGTVEGVRVTLSNRLQTFPDRVVESDALGRFAVRLPDGDWAVRVESPSGRIYTVKNITASGGLLTDDRGQNIPSLIIRR
jgi:hypothetical protein